MEYLVWALTIALVLVGLAGCILPLLPGTTLILAAMVLHKLLLPAQLSWWLLGAIALLWLLSLLMDLAGVIIGTRIFGGSKWGMAGAGGGALVGVFFSLPALLLGTFLGAVVAEKFIGRKSGGQSLRSGVGAATGFLLSTVARTACALAMIALFLVGLLSRA
ncbi:MAG TPA: DUF456 domain-containing protein [Opitutaceae bacterium]|nr:DUF456 domain-containing protein [Opitutaceae bacterium]HRJ48296.1 DUF456 domain-containing protein [Opitutaceae bacterium]